MHNITNRRVIDLDISCNSTLDVLIYFQTKCTASRCRIKLFAIFPFPSYSISPIPSYTFLLIPLRPIPHFSRGRTWYVLTASVNFTFSAIFSKHRKTSLTNHFKNRKIDPIFVLNVKKLTEVPFLIWTRDTTAFPMWCL